jgi:hypothetical protein
MASGSVPPPSQEPPRREPSAAADANGAPVPPPRGEERLGPLAVLRTHKPDGRALLLYSRVEHDAPGEAEAADEPA